MEIVKEHRGCDCEGLYYKEHGQAPSIYWPSSGRASIGIYNLASFQRYECGQARKVSKNSG